MLTNIEIDFVKVFAAKASEEELPIPFILNPHKYDINLLQADVSKYFGGEYERKIYYIL